MADKLQITIIGLGLIGASAGLALRRYPEKVRVVGHDKNAGAAGQAKSMGAVDKTEWNLINATSGADRLLLALPPGEARSTLEVVAGDLKPGCLILNMSGINGPLSAWAAEHLPANVSLVGGYPVQIAENVDTSSARADLFEDKLFCLTPDARTNDAAATLAADLAEAMGAKPFFLDPAEFDGMIAAVEHLPLVMAGALLEAMRTGGVWQDMRKLAGSQYYASTLILTEDPDAAAAAVVANRANVIRWLDMFADKLDEWRQAVASGDEKMLATALDQGLTARRQWLRAQASGDWSETAAPNVPGTGDYLRGLIGLRGIGKPAKKGK